MTTRTLTKGEQTRQKIMDLAEEAVLAKGYAATSIDELIAAAGITKSGFFYHFKDKNELAQALIRRYIERDDEIYDELFLKAEELTEDPLHAYLIFLKLLSDVFGDLPNGHPGCLVAVSCYQEQLFNAEVRALNQKAILAWRIRFRRRLDAIVEKYPPKIEINLDALADMMSVVADGGIVSSKALKEPGILKNQILLYRQFVRLVFLGP
jgi:AcrR family transcriptional regulator